MKTRLWRVAILAFGGLVISSALTASGQDLRAGVEQLAAQIVQAMPEGKQLRVAVADFPDLQGVGSDLGRYIASRLTTRLAQNPKFFVIERQRLGQVLAELKFSLSDLVDPAKAKRLGQMAGVEAIIVGTLSDLGSQVDLDARMIEIETNRMLLGATMTISKDHVVKEMLERGRQESVTVQPMPGTPSVTVPAPGPGGRMREVLAKPLRETAGSLAKRSSGGGEGRPEYAKALVTQYNLLIQKTKAVFKEDPFTQALLEFKYPNDTDAAAGAVSTLAGELEQFFASLRSR